MLLELDKEFDPSQTMFWREEHTLLVLSIVTKSLVIEQNVPLVRIISMITVYCKIRCAFKDPRTEMRALGSIKFMIRNDDQAGYLTNSAENNSANPDPILLEKIIK